MTFFKHWHDYHQTFPKERESFVKTCTIGSYPKIPAGAGPSVRSAIQQFERGALGPRALHNTYHAVIRETVALAADAALDATTDGQIRWYDFFDPLCRDIDNLQAGGLLRWFDNNFYYRHPIVTGRLQFQGGSLSAWAREAVALSPVPIIVALPGPFTVAALAEDQNYHNETSLIKDLVEVLQLEAASLQDSGVYEIQWDEPALAAGLTAVAPDTVQRVYDDLFGAMPLRQSVALYWGPSSPWLRAFQGAARVSVDVVAEPAVLHAITREAWPFDVGLGLVDARDVRLEEPQKIADTLDAVISHAGSEHVWLHPNAGLDLLPPDRAAQKVRLLGEVKHFMQREGE